MRTASNHLCGQCGESNIVERWGQKYLIISTASSTGQPFHLFCLGAVQHYLAVSNLDFEGEFQISKYFEGARSRMDWSGSNNLSFEGLQPQTFILNK